MTNAECKLFDEIKASPSSVVYFDTTYYNIDLSYKTNKRKTEAMYSLKDKGLVKIVKEHYCGKSSSSSGRTATWSYGVALALQTIHTKKI